jgi:hypothetical protein
MLGRAQRRVSCAMVSNYACDMDLNEGILTPKYKDAARTALLIQVPLGIISVLMLDGGRTAKIFAITLGEYWLCAILFELCRPFSPTKLDLWFWRWGFIPCFVLADVVARYFGRI